MTRYLELADYLLIAEAVLGVPAELIADFNRIGLADSALAAPQAGATPRARRKPARSDCSWKTYRRIMPLSDTTTQACHGSGPDTQLPARRLGRSPPPSPPQAGGSPAHRDGPAPPAAGRKS